MRQYDCQSDKNSDKHLATIMLAWLSALWWGIAPWQQDNHLWRAQIKRYVTASALLE